MQMKLLHGLGLWRIVLLLSETRMWATEPVVGAGVDSQEWKPRVRARVRSQESEPKARTGLPGAREGRSRAGSKAEA